MQQTNFDIFFLFSWQTDFYVILTNTVQKLSNHKIPTLKEDESETATQTSHFTVCSVFLK